MEPTVNFISKPLDLKDFVRYSDTFLETGTCVGDGVKRAMDAGFTQILSVEIHKPYHDQACKTYLNSLFSKRFLKDDQYRGMIYQTDFQQIALFLGNTLDVLPDMLTFDKQFVIFLDAHPSGPGTAGHDDLKEKGEASEFHQDNIISKELDIIFSKTAPVNVIMIDDMNGVNPSSVKHMDHIQKHHSSYKFYFYDQQVGPNFYPEKVLVCIP